MMMIYMMMMEILTSSWELLAHDLGNSRKREWKQRVSCRSSAALAPSVVSANFDGRRRPVGWTVRLCVSVCGSSWPSLVNVTSGRPAAAAATGAAISCNHDIAARRCLHQRDASQHASYAVHSQLLHNVSSSI